MTYIVTANGTVEFDWENKTPKEIREELAKQETAPQDVPMAA